VEGEGGALAKMEQVCRSKGSWVDLERRGLGESVTLVNGLRLHVLVDVQGWGRGHAQVDNPQPHLHVYTGRGISSAVVSITHLHVYTGRGISSACIHR
jgi:hypothetical protein